MTLVERKLRMSLWLKVENHTAKAIDNALAELIPQFGDKYREVFKSITGDNGSEFANYCNLILQFATIFVLMNFQKKYDCNFDCNST
ncbi:MAG: hypothetical protein PUE67_06715 [Oscillospiraceae bacterium]|nr:hypothetical protein [Oscillospiraceae bacterium]